MKTMRSMAVIPVKDVARSLRFYRKLGFDVTGRWEQGAHGAADFAIVQRGDVTLALQRLLSEQVPVSGAWVVYIYVSNLQALYDEFQTERLTLSDIRHQAGYACDDFDVLDPDGHLIAFAEDQDPNPGPGLSHRLGRG